MPGRKPAAAADANVPWALQVRQRALQLGFIAVGFAQADVPLETDYRRYREFLAAGRHAKMDYLARNAELRQRVNDSHLLAGARTVICLARGYARCAVEQRADPPLWQLVARYARGRDYHRFVRRQLNELASFVRGLGDGIQARALCDTAPVLERAWAVRAGLGFVGKNGMLIIPGYGSYTVLGEVITTLALPTVHATTQPTGQPNCGECTLCLDACPSGALDSPYVLDARRCLSYATIEAREFPARSRWELMSQQLFGCDRCQEVCPYNHLDFAAANEATAGDVDPFRPLERFAHLDLSDLAGADQDSWKTLLAGTALRRATRTGLARNASLVAWRRLHQGDRSARRTLEIASKHDDEAVRRLARRLLAEPFCPPNTDRG